MAYTDGTFLFLFLPLLLALYWICRRPALQNAVLLIGSLIFYMSFSKRYVIVLMSCILITWYGGKIIKRKPWYAWPIALVNLLPLLFFKYGKDLAGMWYLVMPLGISFYTLQSMSYLFDIRNGKTEPESNLIDYALFVSFFPCIVSGPIQKSRQFLPEIKAEKMLSYPQAVSGILMFLYGLFLKMVIADRAALFTSPVFEYYSGYEGAVVLVTALLYSVEIYADFYGYTCMVSGIARLFGYRLRDNFRQPYFAGTIRDFWKRWHISLTSWLTEYVYIPLGGNRKGTFRKYLNILVIFLVSAVWHGSGLHFAVWGLLHGCYRIIGEYTEEGRGRLLERLGVDPERQGWKMVQRCTVFLLVTFAWVFFRAKDVPSAIGFLTQIFHDFNLHVFFDGTLAELALDAGHLQVLVLSVGVMILVSRAREKGYTSEDVMKEALPVRWILILALLCVILTAGVYGPSYNAADFIYANF